MRGAIAGRSSSVSWQQRTSCLFSMPHIQLLPFVPCDEPSLHSPSARQHSLMLATTQTHQSLSTRFDELEVELQVHPDKTHPVSSSHACFFQAQTSISYGSSLCTWQTHVEEKKMLEQPEPEATKSFMHRGGNASSKSHFGLSSCVWAAETRRSSQTKFVYRFVS